MQVAQGIRTDRKRGAWGYPGQPPDGGVSPQRLREKKKPLFSRVNIHYYHQGNRNTEYITDYTITVSEIYINIIYILHR